MEQLHAQGETRVTAAWHRGDGTHCGFKDRWAFKEDDLHARHSKVVHHDGLLDGVDGEILRDISFLVHDSKAEEGPHQLVSKVQHFTCRRLTTWLAEMAHQRSWPHFLFHNLSSWNVGGCLLKIQVMQLSEWPQAWLDQQSCVTKGREKHERHMHAEGASCNGPLVERNPTAEIPTDDEGLWSHQGPYRQDQ